jgi:predicted membrane protein
MEKVSILNIVTAKIDLTRVVVNIFLTAVCLGIIFGLGFRLPLAPETSA